MTASSRANPFVFVTGGCRSGKSAYAQRIAEALSPRGLYLATARIDDEEMRQRVHRHQEARGPRWRLHELPPGADPEAWRSLSLLARPDEAVLFDCLTLWAAGRMIGESAPEDFPAQCDDLLDSLWNLPNPVIMVSNEVGMGVVPDTAAGRAFRDMAGEAGQKAAAAATDVILMVSGLPLALKGNVFPEEAGTFNRSIT